MTRRASHEGGGKWEEGREERIGREGEERTGYEGEEYERERERTST